MCASLQSTIVEILIDKIVKARDQYQINEFVVCGGVSANSYLRKELKGLILNEKIRTYVPKINYSTDNAAMIACAAADHLTRGHISSWSLEVQSRLKISEATKLYK